MFDAAWYRVQHLQDVAVIAAADDNAVLEHYLEVGQAQGHSSNRLFDEAWHLKAYPAIAIAVQAGQFASAFDAYCRVGHKDRAAHFIVAMHKPDSPNWESLVRFIEQAPPLVERDLRWETRLTVAGYAGPDVDLARFAAYFRVTVLGLVAETEPLYGRHRIFIAPTCFGAGAPYKIHEAVSYGLPVVATELLRRQLEWETEPELPTVSGDDAEAMAAAIVRLCRDEILWGSLREAAFDRLRQENQCETYKAAIRTAIEGSLD